MSIRENEDAAGDPVRSVQPPLLSRDYDFFMEGLRQRELRVQRCNDCGTLRHVPMPMCPKCNAFEWTAQLLQLRHRVRAPGTWAALAALEDAGVLAADDAEVLRDSYRYCERTRNRWYLVSSRAGDALPTGLDDLLHLARSLGTTPSELRESYRRVTRRARKVVERLFYDLA